MANFRLPKRAVRLWWPIRLAWNWHASTIGTHGFQRGFEACSVFETSHGCMPAYRAVYGWTLHLGPIKVVFGGGPPIVADEKRVQAELAKYPGAIFGSNDAGDVAPFWPGSDANVH